MPPTSFALARLVASSFVALSLVGACASPHGYREQDQSRVIEAVIQAQEAAWNRGDLDGYMSAGYLNSPDLTFYSGGDITRGYETIRERYHKRYLEGGREMGRLAFSDVETFNYDEDTGLVRGRWKLEFLDGKVLAGLFSLIVRRTSEGWRIVHDHTSLAEAS
jgi:beta-aspartyl-peptidase (threonine type)